MEKSLKTLNMVFSEIMMVFHFPDYFRSRAQAKMFYKDSALYNENSKKIFGYSKKCMRIFRTTFFMITS
ncbi:hypothetical protein MSMAS_2415 [Methanosarcina mazei S-6]|uniref:Uncharacterized protein n=1 Tax=Methanosarcina mazei S-6 TaxID=213585 RepID=A0A0E3LUP1_METMZ|nr:hypothetical protein MSMAS_2415 [Methanosarcina mazei S-6]